MGTLKVNNIQSVTDGSVNFPQGSVSSQPVTFPSGTASNPSISFTGDTDTGLYRIGSNDIGVSAGGNKVLELDPNTFSTFQGGVERFRIASNGQISAVIPGGSTLYNGFMCRAWVNFDGTGTIGQNQSIRGSGNVSSVTKNAQGDYTINFLVAMPDSNSCVVATSGLKATSWGIVLFKGNCITASNVRISTQSPADTEADNAFVCVAVFR